MSKHTPGPWVVSPIQLNQICTADARMEVARAIVYSNAHETIANARLIAAAPELLEMLQTMPHPEYRTGITNLTDEWYEWDAKRRAAIAKATGEQA